MKVNTLKSIGAIVAGFLISRILSGFTTYLLSKNGIFINESNESPWLVPILFFLWHKIYGVVGSYLGAKLAPKEPMAHALIIGCLHLVLSLISYLYVWQTRPSGSFSWYPILALVLILPCAWLGGKLNDWTTHSLKTTNVNSPYKNP
ncbi:hypothetical protein [Emticicia fontis]